MSKESPYEWYNGRLGIKINFLFFDQKKKCHPESLRLICYRSLAYRLDSISCREIQIRKPFINHPALVAFDSLKPEWQELIVQTFGTAPESNRKAWISQFYEWDAEAWHFYSVVYREGKERRQLESEKQFEYTYNASLLNAVIRLYEDRHKYRSYLGKSKYTPDIWTTISDNVNEFNDVPHTLPVSPDGLRKKVANYKVNKYESLIDGRRGNQNARIVSDEIENLLNNMFAGQSSKPTYTDVARTYDSFLDGYTDVINKSTGEIYDPSNFRKISQSTIRNYLSKWENKIATWQIRGGDRQRNMGLFKPHHEMELPTFAGSLLSIDDRQPPFEYEKGKRMWFYLGLDVASGCLTAFVYGKSKEGIILDFYRQLVRNYTEWGLNLPYELECESSLNSSFKSTFLREGAMFQKVRIEANNARGKYIERINGKLRYEVEKHETGWIARHKAKSESNQLGTQQVPVIPYDQLVEARLKNIEDWNNMPSHANKEMSRFEYFIEMQSPNLVSTNWTAILPHIGYEEKSTCNTGYVILQGRKRMIADNGNILFGEALIAKMKRIEGSTLQIFWLDSNDGSVLKAIAYLNGEYACELMPIPRYNRAQAEQTEADLNAREIQSKYVATVEAFAKLKKQNIDKVVIIGQQPKTLNRKFQIPGLNRFEARTTPTEVIDHGDENDFPINITRPSAQNWRDKF